MTTQLSTVDQLWQDLLANPKEFLNSRKPLEDDYLECKSSVFSDLAFDHLVQEHNFQGPTSKKIKLHDNFFNTIVAIAGMANKPGGGIVLIGVASVPTEPLSVEQLFEMIKEEVPDELRKKVQNLSLGVRLKYAQVIGLDQDIRDDDAASEHRLDSFMQKMAGRGSILFGGSKAINLNLRDPNTWYCIDFVETNREGYCAKPASRPWGKAFWSNNLNYESIYRDSKYLTVKEGTESSSFLALQIRESTSPVYLRVVSCIDDTNKDTNKSLKGCLTSKKNRMEKEKNWIPIRSHGKTDFDVVSDAVLTRLTENWTSSNKRQNGQREGQADLANFFDYSQRDRMDALLQIYIERAGTKEAVEDFLVSDEHCLFITASPGGGKSSLLANINRDCEQCPDFITALHFIDHTRNNWREIIASIMAQAGEQTGERASLELLNNIKNGRIDDDSIVGSYQNFLSLNNKKLKEKNISLCILVDALDELQISEDKQVKKLPFYFIPNNIRFSAIKFIVSARMGKVATHCSRYLSGAAVNEMHLSPLNKENIEEFAQTLDLGLSSLELEQLLNTTEGNPLYLKALLHKRVQNPAYDFNSLPQDVVSFYQMDIERHLQGENGALCKELLALIRVAKTSLLMRDIARILGISLKQLDLTLLPTLEAHLETTGAGRATRRIRFFHLVVAESLIKGDWPLVDEYDIEEARAKIIAWCDCLDEEHSSAERYIYADNHLAAHCWDFGQYDDYELFREFLGRKSIKIELTSRSFLREMISGWSQEDMLADTSLNNTLSDCYLLGNSHSRYTFYRLQADLDGYGYGEWLEAFWEKLFSRFEFGTPKYTEIFINCTSAGKRANRRLEIAEKLLLENSSIKDKNVERRLCHIIGGNLCIPNRSQGQYDPQRSVELLQRSLSILDAMTAEDLLHQTRDNIEFAEWLLLIQKGSQYSATGFYYNQIGKNMEGLDFYKKASEYCRQSLDKATDPYLKVRSRRGIALIKSNIGATIWWQGRYLDSVPLILEAMFFRLTIGQNQSALVNLGSVVFILQAIQLNVLIPFFITLISQQYKATTLQGDIGRYQTIFGLWATIGDKDKANGALEQLDNWHREAGTEIARFSSCWRHVWLSTVAKDKLRLDKQLSQCLEMLKKSDNPEVLLNRHRPGYFLFWRVMANGYLMSEQPDHAQKIITDKLQPWFEQKNFFFLFLKPAFLQLQADVHKALGEVETAEHLVNEAEEIINAGRQQLSGMYFSAELMGYIELLVEESNDDELTSLYHNAKEILATDLSVSS